LKVKVSSWEVLVYWFTGVWSDGVMGRGSEGEMEYWGDGVMRILGFEP